MPGDIEHHTAAFRIPNAGHELLAFIQPVCPLLPVIQIKRDMVGYDLEHGFSGYPVILPQDAQYPPLRLFRDFAAVHLLYTSNRVVLLC